MAFTSDTESFQKVGGTGQEAGFPLVRPTGVISTIENTKLIINSHRNYTNGARASIVNIGAWGTKGPTQSHYFTTSSTSYQEVCSTLVDRALDRTDFIVTADIENCDLEITFSDAVGTSVVDSIVLTSISRDVVFDNTLDNTEPDTDDTYLQIRIKSLDGNPCYIYSLIIEESNSNI
jgi:hypothetical protein